MINELRLDLACGNGCQPGFKGVDIVQTSCTDYVVDLQVYPWPIESNSAEELFCSHYIEHIKHDNVALDLKEVLDKSNTFEEFKANINSKDFLAPSDGLIKFMNEVYRILKPGGKIKITVPYYTSYRAFGDPAHTRYLSEFAFHYFNKAWRELQALDHYELNCDFDAVFSYIVTNELALKSEEIRQKSFAHEWNTIDDLIIELTKR